MDLEYLQSELQRLAEIIAGWDSADAVSPLERDLVLDKLRRLYDAVSSHKPAMPDGHVSANADGDIHENDGNDIHTEAEADVSELSEEGVVITSLNIASVDMGEDLQIATASAESVDDNEQEIYAEQSPVQLPEPVYEQMPETESEPELAPEPEQSEPEQTQQEQPELERSELEQEPEQVDIERLEEELLEPELEQAESEQLEPGQSEVEQNFESEPVEPSESEVASEDAITILKTPETDLAYASESEMKREPAEDQTAEQSDGAVAADNDGAETPEEKVAATATKKLTMPSLFGDEIEIATHRHKQRVILSLYNTEAFVPAVEKQAPAEKRQDIKDDKLPPVVEHKQSETLPSLEGMGADMPVSAETELPDDFMSADINVAADEPAGGIAVEYDDASIADEDMMPEIDMEDFEEITILPNGSSGPVLGEVINHDIQTLADTIHAPRDMASELRDSEPVGDLRHAIGINDKFLMIRDLFGGDAAAYDAAIDRLNGFDDLDDCMIYIAENYAWNANSDGAKFLLQLLERKLA